MHHFVNNQKLDFKKKETIKLNEYNLKNKKKSISNENDFFTSD